MERPDAGGALYDRIGVGYDETRRADPGITARLAAEVGVAPGRRFLDVGCGTGSYTVALAARGGVWTGVDASERMLEAARARSRAVDWRRADAQALPFADASFDGAICTLAAHHFADRVAAFREVLRVIDEGPFVLFACDVARTRRFWLRHYFPRMFERIEAKEPSEDQMRAELAAAGFARVDAYPWSVPDDLVDQFLYCGKRKPELYFDARIRAGISSFADLSDPREVEDGLAKLRADLRSGRFEELRASSPTTDGDYVIVLATRG